MVLVLIMNPTHDFVNRILKFLNVDKDYTINTYTEKYNQGRCGYYCVCTYSDEICDYCKSLMDPESPVIVHTSTMVHINDICYVFSKYEFHLIECTVDYDDD